MRSASRTPAAFTTGSFVGSASFEYFRPGWTVRVMPEVGSYYPTRRPIFSTDDYGTWRDVTLLVTGTQDPSAISSIASMSEVAVGERIWIVGDRTGTRTRVNSGVVADVTGDNARVTDIAIEGGFSGSPVLDAHGRVLGVAVVELESGDAIAVDGALVLEMLRRAHDVFGDAPVHD